MPKEDDQHNHYKPRNVSQQGGAGGLWFMGFVGTLIYNLHFHSGSLKLVAIAIFKAVFWLAYLVYYAFQFMKV